MATLEDNVFMDKLLQVFYTSLTPCINVNVIFMN